MIIFYIAYRWKLYFSNFIIQKFNKTIYSNNCIIILTFKVINTYLPINLCKTKIKNLIAWFLKYIS